MLLPGSPAAPPLSARLKLPTAVVHTLLNHTAWPSHAGVWVQSAKQCHFNMGGQAYYTTNPGLYCGCARSTSALTWEPDSKCADKGPRAPADPPFCRFSKFMNTSAWTLGYWKEGKCHASGLGFGILGSHCTATIGLGGDFNTQLLCRKADPGTPSGELTTSAMQPWGQRPSLPAP